MGGGNSNLDSNQTKSFRDEFPGKNGIMLFLSQGNLFSESPPLYSVTVPTPPDLGPKPVPTHDRGAGRVGFLRRLGL